jgi:hypothetical protein
VSGGKSKFRKSKKVLNCIIYQQQIICETNAIENAKNPNVAGVREQSRGMRQN